MKRIIYLAILLPLILISCEKTPVAHFSASTNNPEVGQDVIFNNSSENAKSYEWDFGDGFSSTERNPVHWYSANGTYDVTLTVFGKGGTEDMARLTLYVVIPTLMEIEVREYYEDYPVVGASVVLYPSITDWDAETNSVAEGFTDDGGFVVFAGLETFSYYVDVWEQNHDNYTLRDEDYATYIRTPDVLPNKITKFIAWVDYVEHTKGELKGKRTVRILSIQRKPAPRNQPEASSDTEGWEELFKRSIRIKK